MHALEVVTTRARLDSLRDELNALGDAAGCPLLRHEWYAAAAEAFTADGDLFVVLARDASGAVVAAAPLARRRGAAGVRLELLGGETMEPQALPHSDAAGLRAVCAAALEAGAPLALPRLPAGSPELEALCELGRKRGLQVVRPLTTRTHATLLQRDWAAFERAMTSRQPSLLRRRRKRLVQEHGEVSFEALSPDEARAEAALADLLRVEAAGWKAREGTSILHDPAQGRFIAAYARRAAAAGLLRLFYLRVAGEVVAGQMVVEHAGRLWGIKLGADERFYRYGVGVMVTHDIMRWGCERGLATFEHLGVAEDYQRRWPTEVRAHSTFRFYPVSAAGGARLALDTLEFMRRRARRRAAAARPAEQPEAA
jgi:CelD/BcsL family acetyltransferase involved in cellulose biosynthesis